MYHKCKYDYFLNSFYRLNVFRLSQLKETVQKRALMLVASVPPQKPEALMSNCKIMQFMTNNDQLLLRALLKANKLTNNNNCIYINL